MSQSRLKNSFVNMFFSVANRIMLLVMNFVLRTIMIRTIGVELLGVNGTLCDILSLLALADLGLHTAITYTYYDPIAKNDTKRITALTCYYKKVYLFIAIFIFCVGLCVLPFLNVIINTQHPIDHLYLYYLLMITNTSASYLMYYRITVLTASQKDYVRIRATIVFNFIRIILQAILLLIFKSYGIYLALMLITTVLCNVYVSSKATKEYPYLDNYEELDKETKKSIFSNIRSVFVYKVSNVILQSTDNTLISMLIGTVYVGYYSNYFLLSNSIHSILTMIFRSTTASVGNLVALESETSRYNAFKLMMFISYCLCAITVPCLILLADDFVKVWLGAEFIISPICIVGIALNLYLSCVYLPVITYREAVGLYRQTRYVMLFAAIINIVLSVVLSFPLGMAGILLATPIARAMTYIWYEPKLLYHQYFKESALQFFKGMAKNIVVIGIVIVISKYTVSNLMVDNYLDWVIKAVCVVGLCLLFVLIGYGREPEFKGVLRSIKVIKKRG